MKKQKQFLHSTFSYEEMSDCLEELRSIQRYLLSKQKQYPEGKIRIAKSKGKIQYYLREKPTDKTGIYIPYKEENKIKTHLQKKYNEEVLKQITKEINSIEKFLIKSENYIENIQNIYSNYPQQIKNYINPIDMSDEDYAYAWENFAYEGKPISEETAVLITNKGEKVRSKSELNIANALYKRKIPYRYECPLSVGNRIYYPDFTILDIKNRREIYWEHRGMMDDRDYIKHAVLRTKEYAKEGIIIGVNLIITEEMSNYPLGTNEIENVIKIWSRK